MHPALYYVIGAALAVASAAADPFILLLRPAMRADAWLITHGAFAASLAMIAAHLVGNDSVYTAAPLLIAAILAAAALILKYGPAWRVCIARLMNPKNEGWAIAFVIAVFAAMHVVFAGMMSGELAKLGVPMVYVAAAYMGIVAAVSAARLLLGQRRCTIFFLAGGFATAMVLIGYMELPVIGVAVGLLALASFFVYLYSFAACGVC